MEVAKMPHKLVVVKQPSPEFYKDEGGKSNMLHFHVRSPVALDQPVTLKVSLYYESDQRVEDKEQQILALCKSEYSAYLLTPSKLEEVIDFRIEKVSRRKDGQRFKIYVEPDYSTSRPRVVLAGVLSEPINVMSKRKTGERIVSRRAPPRAAVPGFPGMSLPLPAGMDLAGSSGPSAAGLLSANSLPFTFPSELSGALAGGHSSGASVTAPVTDGNDPLSIQISFLRAQVGQVLMQLGQMDMRGRRQDKRLARIEARLGITSMDGSNPSAVGAAGSVPVYPMPLNSQLSTMTGLSREPSMMSSLGGGGMGQYSHMGSYVSSSAAGAGQGGRGEHQGDVPAPPAAGSVGRENSGGSTTSGPNTRTRKRADLEASGGESRGKGAGALPGRQGSGGNIQFAVSLVDAKSSGKGGESSAQGQVGGHGGQRGMYYDGQSSSMLGAPILLQASTSQGGLLPPAFMRVSTTGPGGMQPVSGLYPMHSGEGGQGTNGFSAGDGSGLGLGPQYSMSMMSLPMNVNGLTNLVPGLSGYRKLRTTEMEIEYRDGDLMAAGSGLLPDSYTAGGGAGMRMPSTDALGRYISSEGLGAGAAAGADYVSRMTGAVPQMQEKGQGQAGPAGQRSAGEAGESSGGSSGGAEGGPSKRARIVVQEAEAGDGTSVVTARTSDPSLAALAATHAHARK